MSLRARGAAGRRTPAAQPDGRRVIVIDDDPTGTQTVSDVDVVLVPGPAEFARFFAGPDTALYVLSNTRALDETGAVREVQRIAGDARACADRLRRDVAIVLRGDSTLRGHVFAEIDALGGAEAVTLFVPAFPEGGRTTRDATQWVELGQGRRVPVADTEYARDPHFSFASRTLPQWVAETGQGRSARMVPLDAVRDRGGDAVRDALLSARPGEVVIPEAELRSDLRAVMAGLLAAEQAGRVVVVRSASSFAALRAGLSSRSLGPVALPGLRRVLVVCGSHTQAGREQVGRLCDALAVQPVEVEIGDDVRPSGPDPAAVAGVVSSLRRQGVAVLTTPRNYRPNANRGAAIMSGLVATVRAVRDDCDAVVSKGGITSAEVARRAFGATRARVRGQLAHGVALWSLPTGRSDLPYAVVPGNVGGADLLVDLLAVMTGGRSPRSTTR